MSNRHVDAAWKAETGSAVAKVLLVALADHADAAGSCYPSVARLAERTELSRRAVISGLKRLESGGFILVRRNSGSRSTYQVNPCTSCTGAPDARVHEEHPTSAPDAPPPVHAVHPTGARGAPEPSLTPTEPPRTHMRSTETIEDELVLEPVMCATPRGVSAEAIYAAYPRKVGRGQAIRAIKVAFRKLRPEALLEAVKRFASSTAGMDLQFIPYPATWFNGERWADEEPPQPRVNGHEGRAEIGALQARLLELPGNPESKGYDPRTVTPAERQEFDQAWERLQAVKRRAT